MSEIPSKPGRNPAVAFVFIAVMLDFIALGIIVPVLPSLIQQLLHGSASQAARWVGWFAAIGAVMQFFFSPVIGSLSDRFGRRPVLLASMFGQAADYVVISGRRGSACWARPSASASSAAR
jgi:DHA1 family tetracycline resistance protein-like MFS transporter